MFAAPSRRRHRPARRPRTSSSSTAGRSRRCCGERRRPRARWRTRVVAEQNLRFFRTSLLGRAPGFAPGPAPVGPWRPVRLRARSGLALDGLRLRARLEGDDGVVEASVAVRDSQRRRPRRRSSSSSRGPTGTHRAALAIDGDRAPGRLEIAGRRALVAAHPRRARPLRGAAARRRVARAMPAGLGFARSRPAPRAMTIDADGLDLRVNGVAVFARGAVWTPVDADRPRPERRRALRSALEAARDGGMNMVRVVGTGAYESPAFHDLCDELGPARLAGLHVRQLRLPDRRRAASGRRSRRRRRRCSPTSPRIPASPCSAATARSSSRRR